MSAKLFSTGLARFLEDSAADVLARISSRIDSGHAAIGHEGFPVKQAQVLAITYKVFDRDDGDAITASGALTVADVVFDALQTDAVWYQDSSGYNFLHSVPASAFPTGDHKYRIEYVITLAGGSVTHLLIEDLARGILTS